MLPGDVFAGFPGGPIYTERSASFVPLSVQAHRIVLKKAMATISPPPAAWAETEGLVLDDRTGQRRLCDRFGRAIMDLRLSVTDRCNYRCVYCRTGNEGAQYSELATEHYLRMVRLMVGLGIEKVRLTGGEPLLRAGLVEMVRELATLRTAFDSAGNPTDDGEPLDLALTTNGHLLEGLAKPLKEAGLGRVTVSMDAVDPETFSAITRVPRSYDRVLAGIRKAAEVGLGPVKVNCVLLRGFNDHQIEAFAEFSRRERVIVRFIEFMPLEEDRSWRPETVVPMSELLDRLQAYRPLVELPRHAASETARRFTFDDGVGEIGIIAPVSRPFCGHCSRIRITSDGKLRTCLFSQSDHDLYGRMLRGGTDHELVTYIRQVVFQKEERHHIGEPGFEKPSRNMVHIGG
jgi:cyclic pyranopterin phosphate synthase